MGIFKHEVSRRNPNGAVSVYCRQCGREVVRAAQIRIRSIAKCAYCELIEKGITNPEDYVLPQYIMTDPSKPPIPIGAEGEDAIFLMFPEEKEEGKPTLRAGGVVGTAKNLFRALGFGKEEKPPKTESRQIAERRRKGSLYD